MLQETLVLCPLVLFPQVSLCFLTGNGLQEKDRRQRLPAEFLCALDQLTIKCACAVYSLTSLFGAAKQTCINYALFLRDLLPLCDRYFVFFLILLVH